MACQVVVYQGLAAVPLHFLFGRFKKSFFLHPTTYELYGRVGVRPRLVTTCSFVFYSVLASWLTIMRIALKVCHAASLPSCIHCMRLQYATRS